MDKIMVDDAIKEFTTNIKEVYGEKLAEVILFGSCARGDFTDESDVDIMILLNVKKEELDTEREKIKEVESDLDEKYNYEILLSTIIQSYDEFVYWSEVQPFYKNILKEGKRYV